MDTDIAPGGDEGISTPDIPAAPAGDGTPLSARDAANSVADWRYKRAAQEKRDETKPAAAPEAAPQELAPEADEAPPEAAPLETTETTEPEALPTIEPPRSWTKDEQEEFKSYPREAQEKISRREQDRERALRQGQNETAEERKVIAAEREKVEQARQQYEAALPALLQTLQEQQQGEFADIKTMSDVEKLAREDWPRYALWDAQQKKVAAVTQEVNAARDRQANEFKTKWSEFAAKEDALFIERAPEMADKDKATKVADASVAMLKDVGFVDKELVQLWNGEASLSLRDHRAQLIIRDAARYREAQKAAKAAVVKTVPQVQRPGAAAPKGEAGSLHIQELEKQLERTGNAKDAAALLAARRAVRR